jgi:hypothetical protein
MAQLTKVVTHRGLQVVCLPPAYWLETEDAVVDRVGPYIIIRPSEPETSRDADAAARAPAVPVPDAAERDELVRVVRRAFAPPPANDNRRDRPPYLRLVA